MLTRSWNSQSKWKGRSQMNKLNKRKNANNKMPFFSSSFTNGLEWCLHIKHFNSNCHIFKWMLWCVQYHWLSFNLYNVVWYRQRDLNIQIYIFSFSVFDRCEKRLNRCEKRCQRFFYLHVWLVLTIRKIMVKKIHSEN